MPHIALPELPGIIAGFAFSPETAKPMRELAHLLLHEPGSLTPGERELIATYVSSQNDCIFCQTSHGAAGEETTPSHPLRQPRCVAEARR